MAKKTRTWPLPGARLGMLEKRNLEQAFFQGKIGSTNEVAFVVHFYFVFSGNKIFSRVPGAADFGFCIAVVALGSRGEAEIGRRAVKRRLQYLEQECLLVQRHSLHHRRQLDTGIKPASELF